MAKISSLEMSLPESRQVRGYEITRAPLGAFLQAVKQLQDFPSITVEVLSGLAKVRNESLRYPSEGQNGQFFGRPTPFGVQPDAGAENGQ